MRPATFEQFAEKFAACGFRPEAFQPCHGLAEATLFVSGGPVGVEPRIIDVDRQALEARGRIRATLAGKAERRLISSGRTVPEQELVIVDPATRRALPDGLVGEMGAWG